MTTIDLNSSEVDALVRIVEESTRASDRTVGRFVEPARGTLDRAKSERHHLVFGRRGSGKSSLLRKAYSELSLLRKPAAFVDLETFKGHSYPDVLLSVLISALSKFEEWLKSAGSHPSTKTTFWQRLFGSAPTVPPINKKNRELALAEIEAITKELEKLLYAQDGAKLQKTDAQADEVLDKDSVAIKVPVGPASVGYAGGTDVAKKKSVEIKEDFLRSKTDYLNRSILRFQKLFRDIAQLGNGSAFLFLDDLYHIRRSDQASVLDYFHRIAKNNGVWIKVGTIRHRTDHYSHGNPSMGMKLGDDADAIDLDITLEKYDLAKKFLVKLLTGLIKEAKLEETEQILADTAMDRLVLASGGVARDFLTIFRRSIDCARERGGDSRGPRIGAEDVNRASGEHDSSKRDELRRDATEEETVKLEEAFQQVRRFCLDTANCNCFLVGRDELTKERFLIDELVDLKMLHLVHSRISTRDKTGAFYTAYMLDLSQYAGDRKRRNLDLIEFWKPGGTDDLRKTRLIFDLSGLGLKPEKTAH
jgi:hypothetical protein